MLTISRTLLATLGLQLALSLTASGQVQLSLSDLDEDAGHQSTTHADATTEQGSAGHADHEHHQASYSSRVSHDPGWPRKPLWDRPGDVNQSKSPPPRYCQDDRFRAGWPQSIREHAKCSIDSHYSAWYVGGGSAFGLPHSRPRTKEEGTWGLDYSLFKKPQLVWMRWTCGREQGGEGAYETDR